MRVDFPDGQWAEIYAVTEMPRRVTVRLQDMLAEIPEEQPSTAYLRDLDRLRDTLMAMVVKQWSYGAAPGDEAKDVYELPQAAYDQLKEETRPHWRKAGFLDVSREMEEDPTPAAETSTSSA